MPLPKRIGLNSVQANQANSPRILVKKYLGVEPKINPNDTAHVLHPLFSALHKQGIEFGTLASHHNDSVPLQNILNMPVKGSVKYYTFPISHPKASRKDLLLKAKWALTNIGGHTTSIQAFPLNAIQAKRIGLTRKPSRNEFLMLAFSGIEIPEGMNVSITSSRK